MQSSPRESRAGKLIALSAQITNKYVNKSMNFYGHYFVAKNPI